MDETVPLVVPESPEDREYTVDERAVLDRLGVLEDLIVLKAIDPLLEMDCPITVVEVGVDCAGGDVARKAGRDDITGASMVAEAFDVVGRKPPGYPVTLCLSEALIDGGSLTATDFDEVVVRVPLSALLWRVAEALTDDFLVALASPPTTAVNTLLITDLAEFFRKPNLLAKLFGLPRFKCISIMTQNFEDHLLVPRIAFFPMLCRPTLLLRLCPA